MIHYHDPIPSRASKATVSGFAENLAVQMGFAPGDPIELVVADLNGTISYRNPVGIDRPESIRVEPTSLFKIFLPSVTSQGRDRFTIAHELGHFFLHFPLVQQENPELGMKATRWVDETNIDLQRCEWEANWFAASFIMPSEAFVHAVSSGMNLREVASEFGVTESAAKVRAQSLNAEWT